jgi:hypothetical protein
MAAGILWQDFARLDASLGAITDYDALPLVTQWASILVEGNRVGVLAGIDGFGQTMPALKYRDGHGKKTGRRQVPHFGTTSHETPRNAAIAFRPHAAGFDLGLSSSQYQELTGPRLAPRREQSRAIANLHGLGQIAGDRRWEAVCAWADVVSKTGFPFLQAHFDGDGHLPRYDLRPIRDRDMQFCLNALDRFAYQQFMANFG